VKQTAPTPETWLRGWKCSFLMLCADPTRPDPPSNLTEGDTVIEDGRVAVTVHWSPPPNSDLPVSRYKVRKIVSDRIPCVVVSCIDLHKSGTMRAPELKE